MKFLMILGAAALAALTPSVAMAQHHGDRGGHERSVSRHGNTGHVAPSHNRHYDQRYRGYDRQYGYDRHERRYDRHERPRHERRRHHQRRGHH